MAEFNVVQLPGVTVATLVGATGPVGTTGPTGPAGPGAGVFVVDPNGDLMPSDTVVSEAFYEYDGNGDVMPSA